MKRFIWLLLLIPVLLTACGKEETVPVEDMVQPVKFYYCASGTASYGSETGALLWEYRDLGAEDLSPEAILTLYLQGPTSADMYLPLSTDVTVERALLTDGVLHIKVSPQWFDMQGIRQTLAAACVVHTMTGFSNIEAVQLDCGNSAHPLLGRLLTTEDFLLLDDATSSDERTVKLYYADGEGKFLVHETRRLAFEKEDAVPEYIIRQLILGPETEQCRKTLPDGVRLLNLHVTDGVCSVNFSGEFLRSMPENHQEARMAVFSVVNSLTELPDIDRVRILSEGRIVRDYRGLNLQNPLYREELAIAPEKTSDREEHLIYLPCGHSERLAPVPVLIHRTAGRSRAADLLNYLLSVDTVNSYVNSIPDGTMVAELSIINGICSVTFNSAFSLCDTHPSQAKAAVRSVVATLCTLDNVEQVQISINQGTMENYDLSEPLVPEKNWYLDEE